MKSEPDEFSIDDLQHDPKQRTRWEGVRNYQARNMLRDQMQPGDLAFFYHSNCELPGITGIMEIITRGYPDRTAYDAHSHYYDPKTDAVNPRWYAVDVQFTKKLARTISLAELKANQALADLAVVKRGNRLSVMPVTPKQWQIILTME